MEKLPVSTGWVRPEDISDTVEKKQIPCFFRESNPNASVVKAIAQPLY
jgi:ABC-type Zn uptake system ZnuABC Zn-binding protein ZnuA